VVCCPWTWCVASEHHHGLTAESSHAHGHSRVQAPSFTVHVTTTACVLRAAALCEHGNPEANCPCCLLMAHEPDPLAQGTQPNEEQAAITEEPVQPAAEGAVQPAAVAAEPEQPATVVVQPLVATDAAAAAAVVDAAAALSEAVTNAAAAQIGAIAASIGATADPHAAAAVAGAVAGAAADGATATAGASNKLSCHLQTHALSSLSPSSCEIHRCQSLRRGCC